MLTCQQFFSGYTHKLDGHAVATWLLVVLVSCVAKADPGRECLSCFAEDTELELSWEFVRDDELRPNAAVVLWMLCTGYRPLLTV